MEKFSESQTPVQELGLPLTVGTAVLGLAATAIELTHDYSTAIEFGIGTVLLTTIMRLSTKL